MLILISYRAGPTCQGVKPTGNVTPARPETAARRGIALQGTGEAVLGLVGEPLLPRVERWPWLGLGWPESTAASSAAAAGVRSCTGSVLELEVEQSEALGMLYGILRTRWTRRGDQMVTGAASTASSATAEVRPWWGGGYGEGTRGRRGGNGGVAHRGCSGRRSGLGDALETANSSATMIGARRGKRRRVGDAGLPGTREAVGRKRESRRSS